MSNIKRSGLKPLRSSTNIINNELLAETRKSLGRNTPIADKYEQPKVSLTEQIELTSTPIANKQKIKSSSSKSDNQKSLPTIISNKKTFSINKSTMITLSNGKQMKRASQSVEKKKVKLAIKTVLNRDQRIKKWLTSKEPVQDVEYWRLKSERLSKELIETLDRVDELDLDNELLVAEYKEMSKLAQNAYKLSRLLAKINYSNLIKNNNSIESNQTNDDSFNQTLDDSINKSNDCNSADQSLNDTNHE